MASFAFGEMPAIAFDRSIVLRRASTVFPEIGNSRASFESPPSGRPALDFRTCCPETSNCSEILNHAA